MKPKIRVATTHGPLAKGEKTGSLSLTVPNQAVSVAEIISRQARGLSATGVRVPSYDVDGEDLTGLDGRDFRSLDLSEKHDLMKRNAEHMQQLIDEINKNAKEIDEAKFIASIRAKDKENADKKPNPGATVDPVSPEA